MLMSIIFTLPLSFTLFSDLKWNICIQLIQLRLSRSKGKRLACDPDFIIGLVEYEHEKLVGGGD